MLLESQINYIQVNKDLLSQKEEMERMADYCNLSVSSFRRQIKKDYLLLQTAGMEQRIHPLGYLAMKLKGKAKLRPEKYGDLDQIVKINDLIVLWEGQDGKCAISGVKLILPGSTSGGFLRKSPYNVSVDRIDSRLPYTMDNVQLVALGTNVGKSVFTEQQYLSFLDDVTYSV